MSDEQLKTNPQELRGKVAREAAVLLYFGSEKEYKQAKEKAAETLRTHSLPSNREVALELDKIADENEGTARKQRLVQMRQEALEIMTAIKACKPVLIGSVWRGTIRRGSDIDFALCHEHPEEIVNLLVKKNLKIVKTEWTRVTKQGKTEASFHIFGETTTNNKVEIVVRSPEEAERKRKCEIFGDEITGLNRTQLERILAENPTMQFLPA
jgi:predicted nucleotidyltransferase